MAPEGRRYRPTGCGGGERRSGAAPAHERTAWGRSLVPLGTARLSRTSGPQPVSRLVRACPHSGTRSSFPDHDQTVCCAHARAASWCGKLNDAISECHSHPFVPPSPTPNPVGVASFRTTTSMRKRLDSPHTPHGRITADPVPLGTVLDSGGGGDWRASTFSLERLSWPSESIKYITTITGGSLH